MVKNKSLKSPTKLNQPQFLRLLCLFRAKKNKMTFLYPHLLWLLAIPALLALLGLVRRVRVSAAAHPKILRATARARTLHLDPATPAFQSKIENRKSKIFLILGLALAILALARPQWGRIEVPVFDQSREILIALDLSRSMLATDIRPSRLERARLLISALLDRLKGERVGLIIFSGTAFLQSPLSADYEILREFLPQLNTTYLPEGGTNYRALLDTAINSFGATDTAGGADRFLIILSDGEATDDNWRPLADDLKQKNIRVIALGVGTEAGAVLFDGTGGYIKDDSGKAVLSRLESATLQELADKTTGIYRNASGWVDLAQLLDATVSTGRKGEFREENRIRQAERYQWPLAAALLLLAMSYWREFPVRPKPRALRPAAAVPSEARSLTIPNSKIPTERSDRYDNSK